MTLTNDDLSALSQLLDARLEAGLQPIKEDLKDMNVRLNNVEDGLENVKDNLKKVNSRLENVEGDLENVKDDLKK